MNICKLVLFRERQRGNQQFNPTRPEYILEAYLQGGGGGGGRGKGTARSFYLSDFIIGIKEEDRKSKRERKWRKEKEKWRIK